MFIYFLTFILLFICIFPVIRLFAIKCGIIPDEAACEKVHANIHLSGIKAGPERYDDTPDVGIAKSGFPISFRAISASLLGMGFLYAITSGFVSVDAVYQDLSPSRPSGPHAAAEPAGSDWKIVDGIRWFRVNGTDSAGIGYSGWVSELFFRREPPESNPEAKDLMEKIGLPSMKERLEAAKQLRNIGKSLQQALSND